MTNEELQKFLDETGTQVRGVFPGIDPNATQEQINQALHDSIVRIMKGEGNRLNPEDFDDDEHVEQLESDKSDYGEDHE